MDTAVDELQFLSQSKNRALALKVLADRGPLDRDELEARLDTSHRTVIRVVNALTERGYLSEADDGLSLTPFGAHVADRLSAFLADARVALEHRPLLSHGPPALADLPVEALAGAEQVVSSESEPFAVLDRLLAVRADATRIREIAPGVERKSIDQLYRRVERGDDLDVEIVIPETASETAGSRSEYAAQHAATLESDAVDVYVHPEPIRFAAGLADDTATVAVMRDEQPYACAVSDSPELRTWASDLFETYRSEATLKTAD